ncbi:uncharacterized protein BP5553_08855 [Venustampulla echinocandica]|uniref:F-box domain-containing protein n=1 Tax=Venustampulla echinocandica TaxID=2656787 RepID=A0A370TD48_9HELO|nr:uncharacterized protein BP5553_08855 [Venustampulla echinocandica]RDL32399.1 hypothetical protein BP5553_08855 [Venustampulla echinocandica]
MEEQQHSTAGLNTSQFHALTYPRLQLTDNTLDDNLPIQPKCHIETHTSLTVDLGSLDILPQELLDYILPQLDLRTLTDFRRVNRRAFQLVASLPQYKAINTHARDALRGILATGTGRSITCETLYSTICIAECEQCGDFGGYLYILTCKRVCYLCFTLDRAYLPLFYTQVIRKFGLSRQMAETLPQMKSIPGIYTPHESKYRERLALVDVNVARRAGIALHGSAAAMEKYKSDMASQKILEYKNQLLQQSTDLSATPPSQYEGPFDRQCRDPFRYMATVRTPWLKRISQQVELGSYCTGCVKNNLSGPRHMNSRRKFTIGSFNEHLRQCGSIKNGKHQPEHESTVAQ